MLALASLRQAVGERRLLTATANITATPCLTLASRVLRARGQREMSRERRSSFPQKRRQGPGCRGRVRRLRPGVRRARPRGRPARARSGDRHRDAAVRSADSLADGAGCSLVTNDPHELWTLRAAHCRARTYAVEGHLNAPHCLRPLSCVRFLNIQSRYWTNLRCVDGPLR